jgi:hypothetical protein
MTTITIPHPTDPSYDDRHGPGRWSLTLSDAHRVWERAGTDLRSFEGRRAGDCAEDVRQLVDDILADPGKFTCVGYYDLQATTAALTGLFFTLRSREDGIVHVS